MTPKQPDNAREIIAGILSRGPIDETWGRHYRFSQTERDLIVATLQPGNKTDSRQETVGERNTAHEGLRESEESGVTLIAAERHRQIAVEGWTADHDDEHKNGQLADAGAAYAMTRRARLSLVRHFWEILWPWDRKWWKPAHLLSGKSARIRDLEKAGALIAAEIDRLLRAVKAQPVSSSEAKPNGAGVSSKEEA